VTPLISRRAAAAIAAAMLMAASTMAATQTTQQHVHQRGHEVMPFDVSRTVHVFRMTEDGGTQKVVTRGDSPNPEQVKRIQQHLMMEAQAFQKGDFADPAHLHGANMPGLRELQKGAARIRITYRALPNGAEIRFQAPDLKLVTAIHRWFGAQLSEHGADAKAE